MYFSAKSQRVAFPDSSLALLIRLLVRGNGIRVRWEGCVCAGRARHASDVR